MTQEDVAKRIMLFGALFEAEAHIYIYVYQEKCDLVNGILSSDSDMVFHGAQRLCSGYNIRKNDLQFTLALNTPNLKGGQSPSLLLSQHWLHAITLTNFLVSVGNWVYSML